MEEINIDGILGGKKILEIVKLSNGWVLVKTENSKSPKDFKVRTVWQLKPRKRYFTPKTKLFHYPNSSQSSSSKIFRKRL